MSVGLNLMHRKTLISSPDQKYALVYPSGSRSQNFSTDLVLNAYKKYDSIRQVLSDNSIKVDCMPGGATEGWLSRQSDPLLANLWSKINGNSDRMANTKEGISRVTNSNGEFAIVLEQPSLEYAIMEDACLYLVGDRLTERFFAFAVQKGSPLRDELSQALMTLQENGTLRELKRKWWTDRRRTAVCY